MKMKMRKKGEMNHKKIISAQAVFLVAAFIVIYMLYPKVNFELQGNVVKFDSINSNLIVLSENPDFSNPRYIEINKEENISFKLKPGKYYWKAENSLITGLRNEFEINSKVGLGIKRENESELVNLGNVKINVTKTKQGKFVGYIILEPNQSKPIEDKREKYVGRQEK